MEERSDRFTAIEDQYAGYTVVDEGGSKIGKVDDLFLDENDSPGVHRREDGLPRHQLHPDPGGHQHDRQREGFIEVSQPKSTVQDGRPSTTIVRSPPSTRTRSAPTRPGP